MSEVGFGGESSGKEIRRSGCMWCFLPSWEPSAACHCLECGADELLLDELGLDMCELSAAYSWPSLLAPEDVLLGLRRSQPPCIHKSSRLASALGSTSGDAPPATVAAAADEACSASHSPAPDCKPGSTGSGGRGGAVGTDGGATELGPELDSLWVLNRRWNSSADNGSPSLSEAVCGLRTKGVSGSSIFCRVPRSLLCSSITRSSQWTRPAGLFLRGLVRLVLSLGLKGASPRASAAGGIA
mmetsp:Transcript_64541/g.187030  ORF Transcript_64541/g.187030 Transcript_64541/m.187030 type:complete len:242 (-) Transcript_64541:51-776(-)